MLGGLLLGLGASATWALANVAAQRASRSIGPFPALLWAQLVGLALVIVLAFTVDTRTAAPSVATIGWVAVAGASGLLAYVCLFYAFEHGPLSIAVPIMSSWALLSSGLSLLMFDHRVTGGQLAGAACVIVGAIVVSRYAHAQSKASTVPATGRWLLASFGAAIGFGFLIPAMGRLDPVFGSNGSVGVVYVADILLGLPLVIRFRVPLGPPRGAAWWPVFLTGLFETAGFVCLTIASRVAPLALVSPVASLAAPITMAFGWLFLRERPPRTVLVGAAFVCAGVLLLAL